MVTRILPAALAMGLLCAASAARAGPPDVEVIQAAPLPEVSSGDDSPVGAFQALCLRPGPNPEAVLAAAEAVGFTQPPPQLLRDFHPPSLFQDTQLRVKTDYYGRLQMVFVGRIVLPGLGAFEACGAGAPGAVNFAALPDFSRWVGVQPGRVNSEMALYVYVEDQPGERKDAQRLGEAALREAVREGRLHMIVLGGDEHYTLLAYGVAERQ